MNIADTRHAVYLPAVNPTYLNAVTKKLPEGRRFPHGLTPRDLMFWEDNALWHYPYLLHSIGQYRVGTRPNRVLDKDQRRKSILIGDSSGYQIGRGTLSGLKHVKAGPLTATEAMSAWRQEREARRWIHDWLSTQCDYGMTIDMPLWATSTTGAKSPFHRCSPQQLIDMTVQNLRLAERFSPAETKWLNVIQGGDNYLNAIDWFRAVSWFRRGGWALAGTAGTGGGLLLLLMTVLIMRDADAFSPGQNWLHVLGVSTPLWAIIMTAIQKELRRHNPELMVSFDSSSPLLVGGRFEQVSLSPAFTTQRSSWTIGAERAPQRPAYAKPTCQTKFPYDNSPLGKRLMLNELNVREGPWEPRQFDTLSNAMLINHNIWTHLEAFKRANDIAEQRCVDSIPKEFLDCLDVIQEAFACDSAIAATYKLERHVKLLERIAPMTM
jgi:hypothetical protein